MKSATHLLDPSAAALSVTVLVLEQSNTLSFAAAVDPMRAANRQAGRRLFDWHYATANGQPAQLTSGITVEGRALAQIDHTDLVLLVAGFDLARHSTPQVHAGLRRLSAKGAMLAGIDGGPWVLADAGLLDGETATTHWEDLSAFATRFPEVTTLANRFCISGARMTCGGAMPAIDMMLHLIAARYGRKLSARVAGGFIHDVATDPARPQSRAGPDPRHNRLTGAASTLMEQKLEAPLSIPALARALRISPRTLEAQFQARLGRSPKAHYLSLRLAEALRLVTQTDLPLIEVALATGFASPSSFARAFRAAHGTSARALRSR